MNTFDLRLDLDKLDLDKRLTPGQVVRIRQGDHDGTTIRAAIYDHGVAVTEAPDACHIAMRLPDGSHYYRKAATWADGTATVTIDETQATSAVGRTSLAYFQLTYGTDLLSTGAFAVVVESDAVGDAELPEDYDTAIQEAIDNANAAAEEAREAAGGTQTPAKLGFGYGHCTTAAATAAKAVSISDYVLNTGGIVSVLFDHAVPAGSTLNITSKGAKAIYHKGAAIADGVIKAGDTATFMYSGQYHLLSIDRWGSDIDALAARLDALVDGDEVSY